MALPAPMQINMQGLDPVSTRTHTKIIKSNKNNTDEF